MDYIPSIRIIEGFPKEGISFYDVTPIMNDKAIFKQAIHDFAEKFRDSNIDKVVSTEARGFIFGAALAYELGVGFVPIRKAGKLPRKTVKSSNDIEYGNRNFEMHKNDIKSGERVLILDDVLATGGTAESAINMVESVGGNIVSLAFFILMSSLDGVSRTSGYDIFHIVDEKDIIEHANRGG